jgi:hypothetical protein
MLNYHLYKTAVEQISVYDVVAIFVARLIYKKNQTIEKEEISLKKC